MSGRAGGCGKPACVCVVWDARRQLQPWAVSGCCKGECDVARQQRVDRIGECDGVWVTDGGICVYDIWEYGAVIVRTDRLAVGYIDAMWGELGGDE